MKKNNYKTLISILFSMSSLVVTLILYRLIPQIINVRWSSYTSNPLALNKFPFIFTVPIITILLVIIVEILARYDKYDTPRNHRIETYHTLSILFGLLASIIQISIIATQLGLDIKFNFIFYISTGLLIAFIGNYTPRLRPTRLNFLRTKLYLSHQKIWFKSQRLRGYSLLICGLLIMIGPLIKEPYAMICALIILLIALVINYMYVYLSLKGKK